MTATGAGDEAGLVADLHPWLTGRGRGTGRDLRTEALEVFDVNTVFELLLTEHSVSRNNLWAAPGSAGSGEEDERQGGMSVHVNQGPQR